MDESVSTESKHGDWARWAEFSPDSRLVVAAGSGSYDNPSPVGCRCVINATGAFCDELRRQDDPVAQPFIAPSQGVHLILDRSFLPGETAIMVPRTKDHQIMFAIPWQGHPWVGTTRRNRPACPLALMTRALPLDW